MSSYKTYKCCWNCAACVKGGDRFVEDFDCRHPKVKAAMQRKGVQHLNKDKLWTQCPFFVESGYGQSIVDRPEVAEQPSNQLTLL